MRARMWTWSWNGAVPARYSGPTTRPMLRMSLPSWRIWPMAARACFAVPESAKKSRSRGSLSSAVGRGAVASHSLTAWRPGAVIA